MKALKALKVKIPKTPRQLEFEESYGPVLSDEVYQMNGQIFRLIDIHASQRKKPPRRMVIKRVLIL